MSQRKRIGCILDRPCADPALDPGSLLKPMGRPKAEPICHCAPPQKNRLGGMDPCIDREGSRVVCRSCQKPIGPACKRRHVVHFRGLLAMDEKTPGNVDWADVEAAGWLL